MAPAAGFAGGLAGALAGAFAGALAGAAFAGAALAGAAFFPPFAYWSFYNCSILLNMICPVMTALSFLVFPPYLTEAVKIAA